MRSSGERDFSAYGCKSVSIYCEYFLTLFEIDKCMLDLLVVKRADCAVIQVGRARAARLSTIRDVKRALCGRVGKFSSLMLDELI